eukprot:SAG11_NODE_994_length_6261_cov_10.558747_9_plen_42_part_00
MIGILVPVNRGKAQHMGSLFHNNPDAEPNFQGGRLRKLIPL